MLKREKMQCDLCVVGGGMAGLAAAISAARAGIRVVLMQERPVLGGNASSEIRMWVCGAHGDNNRETGIMEEIALENAYRNPTKSFAIWDSVLYDFARREKNLQLLLNCTCMDADAEQGTYPHGRTVKIRSVTGYQMTTQKFVEVEADYFCDSSGDSILAPLTGAEFRQGREAAEEFGEITSAETADRKTMGMSCLLQGRETTRPVRFTPPQWAAKLTEEEIANRRPDVHSDGENFWYLELGGNRDSIGDTEQLRDQLVALALGMWDHVKNGPGADTETWDLDFLGFLPGKRESRRLCGEYMVTQQDISSGRVFPDEVAYGGWPLDDHFPDGFYHRGTANTNYQTPAPYSLPYRALYSKNVDNLFFAGRNISTTHLALSSTRVMATCTLLGEAVGKAAALAEQNGCTPHEVYLYHLDRLQTLLLEEDCFLPSRTRPVSELCRKARLTGAPDLIRNGQDRPHAIYGTARAGGEWVLSGPVTYDFEPAEVKAVHLVFSSDLNRQTLDGSWVEQGHCTRANTRLDSPQLHLPLTLCREFRLVGERNGKQTELLHVTDNRRRCYHVAVRGEFDRLTLIPLAGWGEESRLISFDFQ